MSRFGFLANEKKARAGGPAKEAPAAEESQVEAGVDEQEVETEQPADEPVPEPPPPPAKPKPKRTRSRPRTEPPATQEPAPAKPRRGPGRPRGKRSNQDFFQTSVYLPRDLHRDVKIALMSDDRDMSELVSHLLRNWLAKR